MRRQRPDDMPMSGMILRERKGVYHVVIKFTKSKRHYHTETVRAKDQKAVKAWIARIHPSISFGKEKATKPRAPRKTSIAKPKKAKAK